MEDKREGGMKEERERERLGERKGLRPGSDAEKAMGDKSSQIGKKNGLPAMSALQQQILLHHDIKTSTHSLTHSLTH